MKIKEIYIGGWFQRTALHLNEIYKFLKDAESENDLDSKKLRKLQEIINPIDTNLTLSELDYVSFKTEDGISVRIYEDGLTTLGLDSFSKNIKDDFKKMTDFYENKFSKGMSYIFSLGAPVPKELAKIETIYPYFIILDNESDSSTEELMKEFEQEKYTSIEKDSFKMVQGEEVYIFNNKTSNLKYVRDFIEETIFLREFQGQLERYLNLHRNIWEKIAEVKEKGTIKGSEVGEEKSKIESYSKTINLIETRISQMDTYIHTRENITREYVTDKDYREILEYRYETLSDSLSYVSDLWVMTKNYVSSALEIFSGIQSKATQRSIKGLTVITSVGALAGVIKLLNQKVPTFSMENFLYFGVLVIVSYALQKILGEIGKRKSYKIKDIKTSKDI